MSGLLRISGAAAIFICALTLYGALERSGRGVATDPSALLNEMRQMLADYGLHERDDVLIELNGREVALGFSRPGCDGLMLLALLPHTAQSWAHMAPRLDLSTYQVGYLYDGAAYPSVPRLERLAGQLRENLRPHRTSIFPQAIAIAEAGHCNLAQSAASVLESVSRGQRRPAKHPESVPSMGGAAA